MPLLRVLYLVLFFCLPFTVENFSLVFGINIPGEPLQCFIVLILFYYIPQLWQTVVQQARNPLLWFIIVYIVWSWLSCIYSAMPVVSAKYTLIETLHILVFVAGYTLTEKSEPGFYKKCVTAYTLGMLPILLHGLYLHAHYNFAIDFSAASMRPFYRDHPLYGVVLAFLIPFWGYFFIAPGRQTGILANRTISGPVLAILVVSLFFSFSRAAWLTTAGAGLTVAALHYFRYNLKKLALISTGTIIVTLALLLFLAPALQQQQYVKNTTVGNQLVSSINWKYDVANLERLNRYKCAWRMFNQKPLTGFGNNMYKFTYLNYQQKEDMTRISLSRAEPNAREGTGGNSHSDYLAALTELGLPGLLLWLGIVLLSVYQCFKIYTKQYNIEYLAILCALLTFYVHIAVNNFIHEDKIAALVWMCCGLLLAATSTGNTEHNAPVL